MCPSHTGESDEARGALGATARRARAGDQVQVLEGVPGEGESRAGVPGVTPSADGTREHALTENRKSEFKNFAKFGNPDFPLPEVVEVRLVISPLLPPGSDFGVRPLGDCGGYPTDFETYRTP